MAIDFPTPTGIPHYHTHLGVVWVWNGVDWQRSDLLFPPGSHEVQVDEDIGSPTPSPGTSFIIRIGSGGPTLTAYGKLNTTSGYAGAWVVQAQKSLSEYATFTLKPDGTLTVSANGVFGTSTIWHSGNDGTGSGLDADTVDGEHASAIVTEARIKSALANTADLADTNVLALKQNCDITADGGGAGTLYSSSIKASTTVAAANMVIDATGGFMQRSTSSRRYKKNIRSLKHGLREVMLLRPVTYQGRRKLDGDTVHGGLIAEEVFEAGLTEFVTMRDGRPEALEYGHMVALLVKAMQEQQAQIDALQKALDAAKGK